MTDWQAFRAVVVMALVTAGLRFLPFLVFGGRRKTPRVILYLEQALPCAIMGMLVVYCLRDMSFARPGGFLPQIIAGTLTAISYVWKRNTLLSIVAGTACYMLLAQLVF